MAVIGRRRGGTDGRLHARNESGGGSHHRPVHQQLSRRLLAGVCGRERAFVEPIRWAGEERLRPVELCWGVERGDGPESPFGTLEINRATYVEGQPETQVCLGCLVPRFGQSLRVLNFGQIDVVDRLKQTEVEARYMIELYE